MTYSKAPHSGRPRRLFLGIPIPESVSSRLEHQLTKLPGRKVPYQNWHLTLHFLGNVEEEVLLHIHSALQSISWGQPYSIIFNHVGAFPNPTRARSIWIGSREKSPQTSDLVQTTGDVLTSIGLAIEDRPYVPHLTVRRLSAGKNVTKGIKETIIQPVSMTIDQIILYESILNQGAPEYQKLFSYTLN